MGPIFFAVPDRQVIQTPTLRAPAVPVLTLTAQAQAPAKEDLARSKDEVEAGPVATPHTDETGV